MLPRQQLIKQDAESIDIRAGGDDAAPQLLGSRISRGHRPDRLEGQQRRLPGLPSSANNLAMPKSSNLT